jgi:trehalose/maltose transport system permease protein
MSAPRVLRQPWPVRLAYAAFLTFWCVLAAFPILWITIMSIKEPVDAFAPNALDVITGPATRAAGKGISLVDLVLVAGLFAAAGAIWKVWFRSYLFDASRSLTGRIAIGAAAILAVGVMLIVAVPALGAILSPLSGALGRPLIGATTAHYEAVWVRNEFYRNFLNSMLVTGGVVLISLTCGTLAGYGLSRSGARIAFWVLIIALVFRALPHSVLVAGYLPWFINSADLLRPLLGDAAPTLYGKPWAVIAVLVAINQPFSIWLLRSFFQSIPTELDEAARVDGCTHFQAFRFVIMPVMWPGVLAAGLFSFLLGYNDYLVTSLLLDAQKQTMVPAITSYFNAETTMRDQVEAVAAAVSITAPLLLLILVFQRQIVSGLTAGAVKG